MTALWEREPSEMELRAGVVPLGDLHRMRVAIIGEYKVLWARYGQWGTFDAQRKAYRSAIMLELRAEPPPAGAKNWTESLLEAAASADQRYRDYLDNADVERAKLATLEAKLAMIEEAYNRGQAELRAYSSERITTGPG